MVGLQNAHLRKKNVCFVKTAEWKVLFPVDMYDIRDDMKVNQTQTLTYTLSHDSVLKYLGLGVRKSTGVNKG